MLTMTKPKPSVLYLEIPAELKARLGRVAKANLRKLTAEGTLALMKHIDAEEARLGLTGVPVESEEGEEDKPAKRRRKGGGEQ